MITEYWARETIVDILAEGVRKRALCGEFRPAVFSRCVVFFDVKFPASATRNRPLKPVISLSMRIASALRMIASLESSYVVHQIPDVLVRFDFSKRRHPTQTNSILHNPEQFSIGVASHSTRREIRSARIHPPTVVSECVAVGAMAHGTAVP
jgi:hypothetical protein